MSDRYSPVVPLAAVTFVALCVSSALSAIAQSGPTGPDPCYTEESDCTVCWHAGANIFCQGHGGVIECPDQVIGSDPPYRTVVEVDPPAGIRHKRSEIYGSCQWQPREPDPENGGCKDAGAPEEELNVEGEEVYGSDCDGGGGET